MGSDLELDEDEASEGEDNEEEDYADCLSKLFNENINQSFSYRPSPIDEEGYGDTFLNLFDESSSQSFTSRSTPSEIDSMVSNDNVTDEQQLDEELQDAGEMKSMLFKLRRMNRRYDHSVKQQQHEDNQEKKLREAEIVEPKEQLKEAQRKLKERRNKLIVLQINYCEEQTDINIITRGIVHLTNSFEEYQVTHCSMHLIPGTLNVSF